MAMFVNWRERFAIVSPKGKRKDLMTCGHSDSKFMVNAKNRLGGYAGERGIILFSAPLVESWLELDEDNFSYSYVTQVMADVKEKLPWLYGSYSNTELAS